MSILIERGELMQLPDHCFGVRWPIIFSGSVGAAGQVTDISDQALPDLFVLWEIVVSISHRRDDNPTNMICHFALGDQLPATTAQFNALEPLLGRQGDQSFGRSAMNLSHNVRIRMRKLIDAQGRRLVIRVERGLGNPWDWSVFFVISSIPKTIPDHPLTDPIDLLSLYIKQMLKLKARR